MLSNPFNTPLALEIKPSFQKWLIVLAPHLLVLMVVLSLDVFNYGLKIILVILIIISANYYIFLYLRQTLEKSITMIFQDSSKNWLIKTNNQAQKTVLLMPSSFINNKLILLNFIDSKNKKYYALITPDSLSKSDFRHLFVRIKLGKYNPNPHLETRI